MGTAGRKNDHQAVTGINKIKYNMIIYSSQCIRTPEQNKYKYYPLSTFTGVYIIHSYIV